jgi:F-type H+-transporting ATPase subunit b
MDEILNQLGELVLGSVPTMILFVLLVLAYSLLVRRPLNRILAERRARTTGALEQARASISAAETKTADYEDRLRKARAQIFAEREERIKRWNAERDKSLGEAREATANKVQAAKVEIEQSVAAARQQIEGISRELSEQIVRAVMPAGAEAEVAR